MGATLVDAALQRRTRYKAIVRPRVMDLLRAWPDAITVSVFAERMRTEDIGTVIRWRRPAKLAVLAELTFAMNELEIDTAEDLSRHLTEPELRNHAVKRLMVIRGVGPKTVDYLGMLTGLTTRVAIDRHLRQFAADAGITDLSYHHLQQVYLSAALARNWSPGSIDAAVWEYMSRGGSHGEAV